MSGLKVLICGAGVAGPVTGYWLSKAGAKVTIVERAPSLRTGGQNVDIRGHGLTILGRMGLEETARSNTTAEEGLKLIDNKGVTWAEFPARDDKSFTAEVEIMRGMLGKLLFDATQKDIEYIFDTTISEIAEGFDGAAVTFDNGKSGNFDIVIAADGQYSSTRRVAFGDDSNTTVNALNQFMAWFKVPQVEGDDNWGRWYNAPGRRLIFSRPDTKGKNEYLRVVISVCGHEEEFRSVMRDSIEEQKVLWRKRFLGAGWQEQRMIRAMEDSDDFHMQETLQIKAKRWFQGRTVLVGDAAYAPSPISGMGTTLSITGAYILAGEIAKQPNDLQAAFQSYQDTMQPFAEKGQSLFPGAPWIANPESWWGIKILLSIASFLAWSGLIDLMQKFGSAGPPSSGIDLPEYSF